MISHYTIDKILNAAKIEEVIADFVALKKRGSNYVGLCPFHNEKTPSFSVSAVKGIYKCFGCGASGNVVKFLMDHEKLSYPEALKWLAKKYHIIVEEIEETEEIKKEKSEKDKILEVLSFAQKFFTNALLNTEEGKETGLNYLYNKRKIDFSLIQKFQLGYSPANKKSFTNLALQAGYSPDILLKAGLVNYPNAEAPENIDPHKLYDKFFGRIIFPIADIAGKIIGFGGRSLSEDKNIAKYINSPQSIVYDKSKTLYGIHLSKKSIAKEENCYLVEGYLDVISMHKAGIENVVASSGTSLTIEQVKLIHRFTNHVTVLYDGDPAGIKAGMRAIDMLLEEGLHVKTILFPDNEDPDSFINKNTTENILFFFKNNQKDFIQFKENLLLKDQNEPIEKANAIQDILNSVAKIPNDLQRRIYAQHLSNQWKIEEAALLKNIQKIRQELYSKKETISSEAIQEPKPTEPVNTVNKNNIVIHPTEAEEKELLKHLIKYGKILINVNAHINGYNDLQTLEITGCEYIVLYELKHDGITFEIPEHQLILEEIETCLQNNLIPDENYFKNHPNPIIQSLSIKYSEDYELSPNWKKYGIVPPHPIENIDAAIKKLILSFKDKKIQQIILQKRELLKNIENSGKDEKAIQQLIKEIDDLQKIRMKINERLGKRIILY